MPSIAQTSPVNVTLNPGYISGTVSLGDISQLHIYNGTLSVSKVKIFATGKDPSGNDLYAETWLDHNLGNYTLTVNIPEGVTTQDYDVSSRVCYNSNCLSEYFDFQTQPVSVSQGNTATLDFINSAFISGSVSMTCKEFSSATIYVRPDSDTNYYTRITVGSDGQYYFPVQQNTSSKISGYAYTTNKHRYDLQSNDINVTSGNTANVEWDLVPGPCEAPCTPSVKGDINITGLGDNTLEHHYIYTNEATYITKNFFTNTYSLDNVNTGNHTFTARTFLNKDSNNRYDDLFAHPDQDYVYLNVPSCDDVTYNVSSDASFINGKITLGPLTVVTLSEDAAWDTFIHAYDGNDLSIRYNWYWLLRQTANEIYDTGGNYYYNWWFRDQIDVSTGNYDLIMTKGDWNVYYTRFHFQNSQCNLCTTDNPTYLDSYLHIEDFTRKALGGNYSFIGGETINDQDITYETGAVTIKLTIQNGGTLTSPHVTGENTDQTNSRVKIEAYGTADITTQGEVTFIALPGEYKITVQAMVNDSLVTFGEPLIEVEPGVCKGIDIQGPTLTIETPTPEYYTTSTGITVSGKATDDTGIASILVNGNPVTLTPGNNLGDPNEISFSTLAALDKGPNTILTIAEDASGKTVSDSRKVYRDSGPPVLNWTPSNGTVTISSSVTVQGTATDDNPITDVKVNSNSVAFSSTNNPDDPNEVSFTATVSIGGGENQIKVSASDNSNRTATQFQTITRILEINGLAAYYPFNGNAYDESGHGHDALVYDAVPANDRNGNPNSAYNFEECCPYTASETSTTNGDSLWNIPIFRLSAALSGSEATFTIEKEDGTTFSSSGTMYLKVGTYESHGVNHGTKSVVPGDSAVTFTDNLDNYSSDTYPKDFYARYENTDGAWIWVGPITISRTEQNRIHVPEDMSNLVSDHFTVAMWINITNSKDTQYLFHAYDDRPGIMLNKDNKVWFSFKPDSDSSPLPGEVAGFYSSDPLPTGQWTHIACKWDGSVYKGYVNGVLAGEKSLPSFESGGRIFIGADGGTDRSFDGLIDDVRIYSRVLSESEILELYLGFPLSERNALIDLYNSTNGTNWTNNTNWLGLPGTECDWYGITCDYTKNHITGINLASDNLVGTIPGSIGDMTSLTNLVMNDNQITGSIPLELGNLTNLNNFNLSSNQLTGNIPSQIGNLTNLQNLYLNNNQLTGSIPPALGNLTKLLVLYLSKNQLNGSIPSELGNLTNLQFLGLGINQLSGDIPVVLGSLSNLTGMNLEHNQLTGEIPLEFGNLSNMERLYLHDNQLSGVIPTELANLTGLQRLYLSENQLSGEIPSEFGNLINLDQLFLRNNQLTGGIPPALGNLPNLTHLFLNNNQLTGNIPSETGNLTNLLHFYLNNNQITGNIPSGLSSLSNLQTLNLCSNQLSGSIPSGIGNLSNLQQLILCSNQLDGTIPSEITNLSSLLTLNLYNNQLTGSIPPEIANLSSLQRLFLSSNRLTGGIPSEIGNLSNLRELTFGSNQLTGSIPPEIINLTNLTDGDSNFSYNSLYAADGNSDTFLNAKQSGGDWESTQTVAPTNLAVGTSTENSISLSWTNITYTSETGGYEVYYATTSGGPYTLFQTTADKTVDSTTVTGLTPGTKYYFSIRTVTNSHPNNTNTVYSEYTDEVSATTSDNAVSVLNPAYISGTVSLGDNTGSLHIYNGDYAISKIKIWASGTDPSGNNLYSEIWLDTPGNYTLTVNVPDGVATQDYDVSCKIWYEPGCVADYFNFENQSVSVTQGETTTLDFINSGYVSGTISMTCKNFEWAWVYIGSNCTSYYTRIRVGSDGTFYMLARPEVASKMWGYAYTTNKHRYNLECKDINVASDSTVNVTWELLPEPCDTACNPSIKGDIDIQGLGDNNILHRHYVYINEATYHTGLFYENTDSFDYSFNDVNTGDHKFTVRSFLNIGDNNRYDDFFIYPSEDYIDLSVPSCDDVIHNVSSNTAFVNGRITMGPATVVTLSQDAAWDTFIHAYEGNDTPIKYYWRNLLNGVNTESYDVDNYDFYWWFRDQVDVSTGNYDLILAEGSWNTYYTAFHFRNNQSALCGNPEYVNSYIYVEDYSRKVPGGQYIFSGGEVVNDQDLSYETGSVTVKFRINDTVTLSEPYIIGENTDQTAQRVKINAHGLPDETTEANVTIIALPGTYKITPRATVNGSVVSFNVQFIEVEAGVCKVTDTQGPTLIIENPTPEHYTTDAVITITGKATDDTGVAAVNVNGDTVIFTSTNNPDDPNEVSFNTTISLNSGPNTIQTIVADISGKNASDNRKVYYNSGPIAYYPFNGNANDETGNGHDGTVYRATLAEDRFGNANSAYNFDGDDYIEIQNTLDTNSIKSVSFWINSRGSDGNNNVGAVIGKYDWNNSRNFYIGSYGTRSTNSLDYIRAYFFNDPGFDDKNYDHVTSLVDNQEIDLNVWKHVVVNITSAELEIWIDGQLINKVTRTYATYHDDNIPIHIGNLFNCSDGNNNYLFGMLDDIRIYNRPLSELEIFELYGILHVDAAFTGTEKGTADAPFKTIQKAIDAAKNGNIVIVADGTYTGVDNKNLDFKGKAIIVQSENGPENCIIDSENNGRGFYFHSGEGPASVVSGFTITNGSVVEGGGIYCDSSSPTISDCIFTNNSVQNYGGGIYNSDNSPIIENCIFISNSTSSVGLGGGIYNFNSNPTVTNCIFKNNSAQNGGGFNNNNSNSTVLNSVFIENSAKYGGGMHDYGSTNSIVLNCTFTNNSASGCGGGIDVTSSNVNISNSIFWNNSSPASPQIDNIPIVTYSLIQGGYLGEGNIDTDPLFDGQANGDYHLSVNSPCIGAGTANNAPITDIEGNPRPAPVGSAPDMGAYENPLGERKEPLFQEFQSIPTSGAADWKHFTIDGESYLAVANSQNDTTGNVDSKIYKWDNLTNKFVEFQIIATNRALDWEFFTIGINHYLIVANNFDMVTHDVDSKIYKWNGNSFEEFQIIPTSWAYEWKYFTINGNHYLAGKGSISETDSIIYMWNNTNFEIFQTIPGNAPVDWEFFYIGSDYYMAVANVNDGITAAINSKIYKWNGSNFTEFQSVPTNGARDWEFFSIGNDNYLAVANLYADSKIYKWDGSKFAEFQTMYSNNAHEWESFILEGNSYLALADASGNSKLYIWDGAVFEEIQSFPTNRAIGWRFFTVGSDSYLVVADQENNGAFNIDSKIYKYSESYTLDDGLIAYYPFNRNANDESSNTNNGTESGTILISDRFYNPGSAYSFDGLTSEIVIPDSQDFGSFSSFTITAWVKNQGGGVIAIHGAYCPDGAPQLLGTSYYLTINDYNNKLVMYCMGNQGDYGDPGNLITSNTIIPQDDKWHFVSGIFNQGNMTLYIDGNKDSSVPVFYATGMAQNVIVPETQFTEMADSSDKIRIGSGYSYCSGQDSNYDRYNGAIDDLRMYNRALSETEIQELFNKPPDGLVAYYPFNGNANDESGNGNDGIVNGPGPTEDRFGNPGSAYTFDGIDDWIKADGLNPDFTETEFTFNVWLKMDEPKSRQAIFWFQDDQPSIHLINNSLQFGHTNDGSTPPFKKDEYTDPDLEPINTDIWYMATYTYNSSDHTLRFYLNGDEIGWRTLDSNFIKSPTGRFRIGVDDCTIPGSSATCTETRFFKGSIDDLHIYNRTFSESEIQEFYNQNKPDLNIYVDAASPETEKGTSDAPYNTLSKAINNATPGTIIFVAKSTYAESLAITNFDSLKIQGGWTNTAGTWTRDNPSDPNSTMIMPGTGPAVHLNNASNIIIQGITLQNGLYAENSCDNLQLTENVFIGQTPVRIEDSNGVVIDRNEVIATSGVGIMLSNSSVETDGNFIHSPILGINSTGTSGPITNNTVYILSLTGSGCAIKFDSPGGDISMENNVLYMQGGNLTGIKAINAIPAALLSNQFFGDQTLVFYNDSTQGHITDCDNLNNGTLSISQQSGNICHLIKPYIPCTETQGAPCADVIHIPMPIPPGSDKDNDKLPDIWEIHYFGNNTAYNGTDDSDGDGLINSDEYKYGTDPTSQDTDGDGMSDSQELTDPARNPIVNDAPESPDIYVDAAHIGTETGESHAPFNTIGEAIINAGPDNIIAIATGTYMETVTVANIAGLKIQGGWTNNAGTWNRDDSPNPSSTVIMPINSNAALQLDHAPGTIIQGFMLHNGFFAQYSDNLLFTSNISIGPSSVTIENSNGVSIIRNEIIGTSLSSPSQGLIVENSSAETDGNFIHADFGIQYVGSSGPIANNSVYIHNLTNTACGVRLDSPSGNVRIQNNVLYVKGSGLTGIAGTNAGPAALLDNHFFGDQSLILYDDTTQGQITLCDDLNNGTLSIPQQSGNVCHQLAPYTPCIITQGAPCADVIHIPSPIPPGADKDNDSLHDLWEIHYFGDTTTYDGTDDSDGDGLINSDEYKYGTDPNNPDTDGDGMSDSQEATDPVRNPIINDAPEFPDIYVDAANTEVETGDANAPFSTIGEAVSNADPDDIIAVAKGIYTEDVTITNISGLKIKGGWTNSSGTWHRDDSPNPSLTVIMPGASTVAVHLDHAPGTNIQGFMLHNGLLAQYSDNLLFAGNISVGPSPVRVENSTGVSIVRNEIIGPSASSSYGLVAENSVLETDGNFIHADFGIFYDSSSGPVTNNSIYIQSITNPAFGINISSGGNVQIANNVLYMMGSDLEAITAEYATVTVLSDNLFFGDEYLTLFSEENAASVTAIEACQYLNDGTLSIPVQGGNICHLIRSYMPCFQTQGRPCVEVVHIPRPIPPGSDKDQDGIPDEWEIFYFNNTFSRVGTDDSDGDNLSNIEEYMFGTDPSNWDSDEDGIADDWEIANGMNPLTDDTAEDPDNDGLSNMEEYSHGTDLTVADTDNDGIPDGWEINNGLDPTDHNDASEDKDNDGYSNFEEYKAGTDPDDPGSYSARLIISIPSDKYATIQEAIEEANLKGWGEIFVDEGTYNENIKIYNGIWVTAKGDPAKTIIDSKGKKDVVTLDNIQIGGITGFTIQNSGSKGNFAGIKCIGDNITPAIANCIIRNNNQGINVKGSAKLFIANNIIADNSEEGLYMNKNACARMINNIIISNNGLKFGSNNKSDFCSDTYYNTVWNNGTDYSDYFPDTRDNIFKDPLLADPGTDNYYLSWNSPCIDTGSPDFQDMYGTRSDMGVYGKKWFGSPDDTDDDGMPDDWEIYHFEDLSRDGTGDRDIDGLPDRWEIMYRMNPLFYNASEDPDNDSLSNLEEYRQGTDPTVADGTSNTK